MRCTAVLTLALAVCLPAYAGAQEPDALRAHVSPRWSGHSLNTDSILARADLGVARVAPVTRLRFPGTPWLGTPAVRRSPDRTAGFLGGMVVFVAAKALQRDGTLPHTIQIRLHRELDIGYPVYVASEILAPAGAALGTLISRQFD